MTRSRYMQLDKAFDPGEMTLREVRDGWHYCTEWDGLLIGPGMGELRFCSCLPVDHMAYMTVPDEDDRPSADFIF